MWISVSVTPTSVALGFSLLDWADAVPTAGTASATSTRHTTTTFRTLNIVPPGSAPLPPSGAGPHSCRFGPTMSGRSPRSRRSVAAGRVGPQDDADGAVEADVVPGPPHEDADAVLEADEVVEVHHEPHDPPDEAGERQRSELSDGGAAADGGQHALVAVAERPGVVADDLGGDESTGLHRGRGDHRQHRGARAGTGSDVTDRVRAGRAGDAEVVV